VASSCIWVPCVLRMSAPTITRCVLYVTAPHLSPFVLHSTSRKLQVQIVNNFERPKWEWVWYCREDTMTMLFLIPSFQPHLLPNPHCNLTWAGAISLASRTKTRLLARRPIRESLCCDTQALTKVAKSSASSSWISSAQKRKPLVFCLHKLFT
jgi:hypothetical protein